MSDDGCRQYQEINFQSKKLELILWIKGVIDEYSGMSISVRQIYYQGVARGIIPNSDRSYDRIQSAVNDGRLAGYLPWTAIEDRGRSLMGHRTWISPAAAVKSVRREYKMDLWASQDWRPEVWVEKAALEGVVGDICSRLRVDFYATRGYDSQSQQWAAGQRLASYVRKGQRPIIFHLGDHDPSGIDMTRDITERLTMFTGVPVIVQRLALNMRQIEQYNPPPFHAKLSDARAAGYIEQYGRDSWELDALDPNVIKGLIEDNVAMIRDESAWSEALAEEVEDKRVLDDFLESMNGTTEEE